MIPSISVSYSNPRRPTGAKATKEKKKKGGEDELTKHMVEMVKARKDVAEDRKLARLKHEETEARRVAAEERRIALEEKKIEMEEQAHGT